MRRADRLYALVEELRVRAPRLVGRAQLARELEVTPRTVERDILALQQAGVPIWSQRGRGGGYAIDPHWSLPPLNFDATEALAVIAALTAARSMPYAQAGRRAARKVLAAMTAGEAARAKDLAGRVHLGSFGVRGARGIVAAVERAVERRTIVRIDYRDRNGAITARHVEAHGLHLGPDGSYLLGWCRLRDAARTFRLDRIVAVQDTGEVAPVRRIDGVASWIDDAVVSDVAVTPELAATGDVPDDAAVTGRGTPAPGIAGRHQMTGPNGGATMPSKPTRARRGGPPRKADHRTGATPGFAVAVAGRLPGVDVTTRQHVTSFSIGGDVFLAVDEDDDSVVVERPTGESHSLLLRTVGRDELRSAIEAAWEARSPGSLVRAWRAECARREQLPPVTHDDIRQVALALPGVTEGPIWGQEIGFRIGAEKKTRFARFGPPEGGGVGNLLPPDEEGTLVFLHCPQRSELLAASPDRFFTTPHYGAPGEPGGLITRLCENRGADELAELAELMEDAWREVAPPELVGQLDAERGEDRR